MRITRAVALSPIVLLTLVGCGSIDTSAGNPSPQPSETSVPDSLAFVEDKATSQPKPEDTATSQPESGAENSDFDSLLTTVTDTCEQTDKYGVRASAGVQDLWYHMDAQWIELSDGLMFDRFVTVNSSTGEEVPVQEIPQELLTDEAIAAVFTCFSDQNSLEQYDYGDPGIYEPYNVVPRGSTPRPSRPE